MTEMPPPIVTADAAQASVMVQQDTPCRKCGYNVRGLPNDGRCPECGTLIAVSLYGNLLRYSDPVFVDVLRRGFSMVVGAICAMVVTVIIGAGTGGALGAAGRMGSINALGVIVGLLMLAAYVFMIVGSWLITTPDPSGLGETDYGTARRLVRIALIVGLGNQALDWGTKAMTLAPDVTVALQAISAILGLVGLVGMVALLYYISKLAMRLPNQKLTDRARFLMFALPISYGVILVSALLMLLSAGMGGQPSAGLGCFMAIVGLAVLVFLFVYLLLLNRMRRAMNDQAAMARFQWNAVTLNHGGAPPA